MGIIFEPPENGFISADMRINNGQKKETMEALGKELKGSYSGINHFFADCDTIYGYKESIHNQTTVGGLELDKTKLETELNAKAEAQANEIVDACKYGSQKMLVCQMDGDGSQGLIERVKQKVEEIAKTRADKMTGLDKADFEKNLKNVQYLSTDILKNSQDLSKIRDTIKQGKIDLNPPPKIHTVTFPSRKAEAKPPPKEVEAKPPPKEVEAKPLPRKVEAKPPPKEVEAKPPPRKVEAKPPPKKVEAKPPPKKVEAKPPPKEVEAKPPPKKVEAKSPPKEGLFSTLMQNITDIIPTIANAFSSLNISDIFKSPKVEAPSRPVKEVKEVKEVKAVKETEQQSKKREEKSEPIPKKINSAFQSFEKIQTAIPLFTPSRSSLPTETFIPPKLNSEKKVAFNIQGSRKEELILRLSDPDYKDAYYNDPGLKRDIVSDVDSNLKMNLRGFIPAAPQQDISKAEKNRHVFILSSDDPNSLAKDMETLKECLKYSPDSKKVVIIDGKDEGEKESCLKSIEALGGGFAQVLKTNLSENKADVKKVNQALSHVVLEPAQPKNKPK